MEAANDEIQSILTEIDSLFEPSPTLHIILMRDEERLLQESAGGHVTIDMIDYIKGVLDGLSGRRELDEILNVHPRLGDKKIESVYSMAEQRNLSRGPSDDGGRLNALNVKYEETFPGLRYVVFVNGRSRDEIMVDMQTRIERGDISLERRDAVDAMIQIAKDRLSKMGRS